MNRPINADWATDQFAARADAREAENARMERINAKLRQMEAHPVAVGRIAPRPDLTPKPVMRMRPAHWAAVGVGALIWVGAAWLVLA